MAKAVSGGAGLIRGKVGGWVFYVVNGQQRIRELTPVFNPQSARQMEIRSINTELSRFWRDELTEGQRTAWRQIAEGSGIRGGLFFIKQNFIIVDFGLPIQVTPPPSVMPPELLDLSVAADTTRLMITVPHVSTGVFTSQEPFIDIEVAGGFLEADYQPPVPPATNYELSILSQALSEGRLHQESDFRHVIYVEDTEPPAAPGDLSNFLINIPEPPAVRNVVARVTRYNKYGNATVKRIFNKIITAA